MYYVSPFISIAKGSRVLLLSMRYASLAFHTLSLLQIQVKYISDGKTSYTFHSTGEARPITHHVSCNSNAPINVKPQGGGGGRGRATHGTLTERAFPRVGNLTWPPSWKTERNWK